ncbi:UNKNOWN [Stylonychia lemnae]|uniref:Kelch motif family protein n=1 Tax=Stylonychia lemnae TaxID=5949 RepID=A0A078ASG2_STYLE|nr:UNKNOWN [Stylonychia lemnae]|eukprot:CDW85385.1 UNKNOWN [Stylonychia lemnae]
MKVLFDLTYYQIKLHNSSGIKFMKIGVPKPDPFKQLNGSFDKVFIYREEVNFILFNPTNLEHLNWENRKSPYSRYAYRQSIVGSEKIISISKLQFRMILQSAFCFDPSGILAIAGGYQLNKTKGAKKNKDKDKDKDQNKNKNKKNSQNKNGKKEIQQEFEPAKITKAYNFKIITYDIKISQWNILEQELQHQRQNASVCLQDDSFYVFGGCYQDEITLKYERQTYIERFSIADQSIKYNPIKLRKSILPRNTAFAYHIEDQQFLIFGKQEIPDKSLEDKKLKQNIQKKFSTEDQKEQISLKLQCFKLDLSYDKIWRFRDKTDMKIPKSIQNQYLEATSTMDIQQSIRMRHDLIASTALGYYHFNFRERQFEFKLGL